MTDTPRPLPHRYRPVEFPRIEPTQPLSDFFRSK